MQRKPQALPKQIIKNIEKEKKSKQEKNHLKGINCKLITKFKKYMCIWI